MEEKVIEQCTKELIRENKQIQNFLFKILETLEEIKRDIKKEVNK